MFISEKYVAAFPFVCPPACLIRVCGSKQQNNCWFLKIMSYHCHVGGYEWHVLMLIKYISHLGGVNGTQVTINLTLRAVLSCVPTSGHAPGMMERMWYDALAFWLCVCMSLCVCEAAVYSEFSKGKSEKKMQEKAKGKLTWQKNKGALHYCHMVRWPKHGGHHQGHHAFVCRKTRAYLMWMY